jgi:ribosome maturation factor RimP
MANVARLEQLIAPEAEALGFELVRVALISSEAGEGAPALQVMAEDPATGQLTLDQCGELSRRISEVLDAHEERGDELVPGSFHLEVSSPGIDRPLMKPADYARFAGHVAKVELKYAREGRRRYTGTIKALESEAVVLDTEEGSVSLPLAEIERAKLVLTDALLKSAKPLNA